MHADVLWDAVEQNWETNAFVSLLCKKRVEKRGWGDQKVRFLYDITLSTVTLKINVDLSTKWGVSSQKMESNHEIKHFSNNPRRNAKMRERERERESAQISRVATRHSDRSAR